jgi:feruloyl esterase
MLRGSERSWLEWFGSRTQPAPLFTYVGDLFRYYLLRPNPGPTWQPDDFDFDRDYKRVGDAAVIEPLNPDLRRFKAAGGKLIAYSGWNDNVEGVLNTTDYYETAQAVAGGRKATQEFFRLFMIPGMNHCSGGDGAFAIDYLSYLENWVEEGVAPDKVIGAHLQLDSLFAAAGVGDSPAMRTLLRRLAFPLDPTTVEFSRPIFPYPVESHYSGNGNPAKAENFIGVEPHH